jgi:hypothetical protein
LTVFFGAAAFLGAAGFLGAAAFFDAAPLLRCLGAFSISGVGSSSKFAQDRFLLMFETVLLIEPGEGGMNMADASVQGRALGSCAGAVLGYQVSGGVWIRESGEDKGEESILVPYMVDLVFGVVGSACSVRCVEVA